MSIHNLKWTCKIKTLEVFFTSFYSITLMFLFEENLCDKFSNFILECGILLFVQKSYSLRNKLEKYIKHKLKMLIDLKKINFVSPEVIL